MTETTSTPPPAGQAPNWAKAPKAEKTGTRSGLALAGAGSVLAVLAFLGGAAVGHAWGSSDSGPQQTQLNGPGDGRFRQPPGQGRQPGQGTEPGEGRLPGQGRQPAQGTEPGEGRQPA